MGAITTATRAGVLARADGKCEWCGLAQRPLELHHRLYRGRGGTDTAENLVALCGRGNHSGCHGRAHGAEAGSLTAALAAGMTVGTGGDPARVPILSRMFGILAWLHENGDISFSAPEDTNLE